MPGAPSAKEFKPNSAYAQKVVTKQAPKVSDHQDVQKQRLLQSESPRTSIESPRNESSRNVQQQLPQRSQSPPLVPANPNAQSQNSEPLHQQHLRQQQQLEQQQAQVQTHQQPGSHAQQQQQPTAWQWQPHIAAAVPVQSSPGSSGILPKAQNGPADSSQQLLRQGSPRPLSAPMLQSQAQEPSQDQGPVERQNGGFMTSSSRPRTATVTASPRVTNDSPLIPSSQAPKNVQWQDAQGNDLCQYREFDPSEQDESEGDEEQWHSQKKGCCNIM